MGLWGLFLLLSVTACRTADGVPELETGGGPLIQNKGSDTIVNLALAWAERYQQVAPEV